MSTVPAFVRVAEIRADWEFDGYTTVTVTALVGQSLWDDFTSREEERVRIAARNMGGGDIRAAFTHRGGLRARLEAAENEPNVIITDWGDPVCTN